MTKTKLLQFKQVYIWVKQKKLLNLYYLHAPLKAKERCELQSDLRRIDEAQNRLLQVRSVVEKILLRGDD
mgnify:CR=1 FL=1